MSTLSPMCRPLNRDFATAQILGMMSPKLAKTSIMDPADQIITLDVGGDQPRLFRVHQGVLCRSSAFFKRATKPEWADQRDDPHVIDLSDDTAQPVQDYINWCYTGTLPINTYKTAVNCGDKAKREIYAKEVEKVYAALATAYAFGEKIIDNMYKNAVMDSIVATYKASGWTPGPDYAKIIYENTTTASPARRLLCDIFANGAYDDSGQGVGWISMIRDHPKEFVVDATQSLLKLRPRYKGNNVSMSTAPEFYHEKDEA